jgi:hypothetical protein
MRRNDHQKCGQTQIYYQLELHFAEDSIRIKANAINIGPGGIGLHSPKRIPVGQKVAVSIGFLNDPETLQFEVVDGTVKWCRTHGPGFMAGIEFNGINPHQHPRLVTLLQHNGPLRETIRNPKKYED